MGLSGLCFHLCPFYTTEPMLCRTSNSILLFLRRELVLYIYTCTLSHSEINAALLFIALENILFQDNHTYELDESYRALICARRNSITHEQVTELFMINTGNEPVNLLNIYFLRWYINIYLIFNLVCYFYWKKIEFHKNRLCVTSRDGCFTFKKINRNILEFKT